MLSISFVKSNLELQFLFMAFSNSKINPSRLTHSSVCAKLPFDIEFLEADKNIIFIELINDRSCCLSDVRASILSNLSYIFSDNICFDSLMLWDISFSLLSSSRLMVNPMAPEVIKIC